MAHSAPALSTGARFMTRRLEMAARHRARGQPCFAVFDLDNTLFDTRYRTLHVARQFDKAEGTGYFASLTVELTGVDAADTCERVGGIPPGVRRRFEAAWRKGFWAPESFTQDRPVAAVLAWARQAHADGLDVRFLTGRWRRFEATSVAQLRRAGLRFVDESRAFHKPNPRVWTSEFKAGVVRELMGQGFVAWYATESRREIAHIQAEVRGAPCVLVDCSLEPRTIPIRRGTPRLDRSF